MTVESLGWASQIDPCICTVLLKICSVHVQCKDESSSDISMGLVVSGSEFHARLGVWGVGCSFVSRLGFRYWVSFGEPGFRVQGLEVRVQGCGVRVQGLRVRVQGLGVRVQGLGVGVLSLGLSGVPRS